jgi:hypothetical protein
MAASGLQRQWSDDAEAQRPGLKVRHRLRVQYNAIGETTQPYGMCAFAGQSHLRFWPRFGAPATVGQPLCFSPERIRTAEHRWINEQRKNRCTPVVGLVSAAKSAKR